MYSCGYDDPLVTSFHFVMLPEANSRIYAALIFPILHSGSKYRFSSCAWVFLRIYP
jgi:hypothetical protein